MSDFENKLKSNHILERWHGKFLKYYLNKFPRLFHICYDPVGYHKDARTGFGFALGFFLAIFLYFFFISDLISNKYLSLICAITLIVLLSYGCAYSLRCRCICLLTIPGLFGKAGRSVLKALVLGYIIAGPVLNLTANTKEVVRCFACTGQLTYNLTKTKYDLMLAPFKQAMENLNESAAEIRDTVSSIDELVEPISKEIEGPDDNLTFNEENGDEVVEGDEEEEEVYEDIPSEEELALERENPGEFYEQKYRRKLTRRCEEQLSRGSENCRRAFGNAYDKCYESVTWVAAWIVCMPMKLTFVCNLVQSLGGGSICEPEIDVGVGQGYAALKETRKQLTENLKDAKVRYKLDVTAEISSIKEMSKATAGIMRDFEARKRLIDAIVVLIKRCFTFIFLKIVLNAAEYHSKYLTDLEHDNVYVTPYFKRIDARRKARGSATLLPLRKLERTKLVDPYNLTRSRNEKRNFYGQTIKLLLEIITASIFVLLDKLLFDLLDVVRKHAKLEISQRGRHDVSLEVKGTGLVAGLVRKLIRGFSRRRHVSQLLTNEPCLPRPRLLPRVYLLGVYGGYLGVWLMLQLQAYSLRLRPAIAGFFYHRREKRRVLYLYNETLRRREGFLRWARSRAAEAARARLLAPEAGLLLDLRERRPKIWAWLRRLGIAGLDCVVCGEPEPRHGSHRTCRASDCLAAYCEDCWRELGQSCWSAGCAETPDYV